MAELGNLEWQNGRLFRRKLCQCKWSLMGLSREYLRGKYHCTIDLLFDWFGLAYFANKNKKMSVVIQLIPNQ